MLLPVRQPIIVWGLGEMGGVFARAFLRAGHVVAPVRRGDSPSEVAARVPDPALVMVCVGEGDLAAALGSVPNVWKNTLGLLQNELLPRDWRAADIDDPTVAVVWFEKKPGTDVKVILPTPIAGPRATLVADALMGIGVDATAIDDAGLVRALVEKNLYILTANIAGLVVGGTVGELLADHRSLVDEVATETLAIQAALAEQVLPRDALLASLYAAFAADPDHKATGRSAPARLSRALEHARRLSVPTPRMRAISQR